MKINEMYNTMKEGMQTGRKAFNERVAKLPGGAYLTKDVSEVAGDFKQAAYNAREAIEDLAIAYKANVSARAAGVAVTAALALATPTLAEAKGKPTRFQKCVQVATTHPEYAVDQITAKRNCAYSTSQEMKVLSEIHDTAMIPIRLVRAYAEQASLQRTAAETEQAGSMLEQVAKLIEKRQLGQASKVMDLSNAVKHGQERDRPDCPELVEFLGYILPRVVDEANGVIEGLAHNGGLSRDLELIESQTGKQRTLEKEIDALVSAEDTRCSVDIDTRFSIAPGDKSYRGIERFAFSNEE
jgi:hypothetical protein